MYDQVGAELQRGIEVLCLDNVGGNLYLRKDT